MSLDWISAVWGSPANAPEADRLARLAQELLDHLAARARRLALVLVGSGGVLLTLALVLGWRLVTEGGGEVGALAVLLAPAALAFGLVLRRFRSHRRDFPFVDGNLASLVRAADDETRMARSRVRTIAALHLLSVPALAWALITLVGSGKVRPHEWPSLAAVLGALVSASLVGLWLHDRYALAPRQRQLRALVASYAEGI